jgi:pteridine reductase
MSTDNASRVALITGGAKRVGRSIVERFLAAGFDVAFTYLASEQQARDLESAGAEQGRRCMAIRADLSDPETATQTIADAIDREFGRLHVLVNNASVYEPTPFDRIDLEVARRAWRIHVEAPLLLCQRLAPLLRRARGHVVNMVDLLAEKPWPRYMAYAASKAALANLTLSLARELAPEVTVNGIAPGVVEWPDDYPQAERDKYLKRVPLGRAGTPRDVAEAIHFLCTSGSYITGQIIRLDGGRSIS